MKCKTCAKMINISLEKFPDTVNVQEISIFNIINC